MDTTETINVVTPQRDSVSNASDINVARHWFNRAWTVVDALRRFADSIKRSLPATLFENKRHLSFLNDEGQPFKMIFGVCGFTIRPAGLHLERS
jgi:hypothetical protein